jgi:hypothetical protein
MPWPGIGAEERVEQHVLVAPAIEERAADGALKREARARVP